MLNVISQESWLKEQRAKRLEDWRHFMDNMCQRSAQLDREVKEESQKVLDYYKDIEEKLFSSTPKPSSPNRV